MRIYLLFFILLFSQVAFSQDTYYKSSIITLKNDTVRGFISNIYDAKTIKFKTKKNDKPTVYSPSLLRGYILDGNVFETRIVNVPYYKDRNREALEMKPTLEIDLDKGRFMDTVFLHKLVKGNVSCFKMNNNEGFSYFFIEKNGILKELPPPNCRLVVDSSGTMSKEYAQQAIKDPNSPYFAYLFLKRDYLDTLSKMLNDKAFKSKPVNTFDYSESSLKDYVVNHNKKMGVAKGGILKAKVSRRIFTGLNVGFLFVQKDEIIKDSKVTNSLALRGYGLYPMIGFSRNLFARFGVNYFSFTNDVDKKSIFSGTFGLRFSAISGIIRPYLEGSVGAGLMSLNNRPKKFAFPLMFEGGVNIPVKNNFINVGLSVTPILDYQNNGYSFAAFNVGILF